MFLQDLQIELIEQIQFEGLLGPMEFVSDLGRFQAYLVLIGFIYWAVDPRLGARLGLLSIASGLTNRALKAAFAAPRPFWVDADVAYRGHLPSDHGFPSGHAQGVGTTWGGVWAWTRLRWVRAVAAAMIIVVGLSRPVLGVHSFGQIIVGYLVAAAVLLVAFRYEAPIVAWFDRRPAAIGVAAVLGISLAVVALGFGLTEWRSTWTPDPDWRASVEERLAAPDRPGDLDGVTVDEVFDVVDFDDWPEGAGLLAGLGIGVLLVGRRRLLGTLQGVGPGRRLVRLVVGAGTTGVAMAALGAVFPAGDGTVAGAWGPYLEQLLLGLWLSAGTVLFLDRLGAGSIDPELSADLDPGPDPGRGVAASSARIDG